MPADDVTNLVVSCRVVIKDGGRGCHMTTHEGSFWLPAYQIDVADTVGCGDSFAAAVVLGFIRGEGRSTFWPLLFRLLWMES